MKNKFVASAFGFIGLCSLVACSASSDAGSSVAKTERVATSQSQALTIENGECSERAYTLPAPQPIFQAADMYETAVAESNDPAVVYSPRCPRSSRARSSSRSSSSSRAARSSTRPNGVRSAPRALRLHRHRPQPRDDDRRADRRLHERPRPQPELQSPQGRERPHGLANKGFVDGTKLAVVGHSLGGARPSSRRATLRPALLLRPLRSPCRAQGDGHLRRQHQGPPARNRLPGHRLHRRRDPHDQRRAGLDRSHRERPWHLGPPRGPKAFFRINGANHYGINNENNQGGSSSRRRPSIRLRASTRIAGSTALWLGIHVQGNGLLGGSLSCFSGTSDGNVTFEN